MAVSLAQMVSGWRDYIPYKVQDYVTDLAILEPMDGDPQEGEDVG